MKMIEPDPHDTHPLEVVVRMTGSSRRKISFYCRKGVIAPIREESGEEWHFDEQSVMRLRHIEALRQQHRMNWAAIHTIISLLDELEILREELRFRR
jgi:DNA-binding transcriptional MerR regulator